MKPSSSFFRTVLLASSLLSGVFLMAQEAEDQRREMRRPSEGEFGPSQGEMDRGGRGSSSPRQNMGGMMGGMGGSTAVAVSDGHIFVVSQGQLLKYHEKTMKLEGKTSLMPGPRESGEKGRESMRQGDGMEVDGKSPKEERQEKMNRNDMPSGGREGGDSRTSQGPGRMMSMMSGVSMTVANGNVIIISGGRILKFSQEDLSMQGSVELEKMEPPRPSSRKDGSESSSKKRTIPPKGGDAGHEEF